MATSLLLPGCTLFPGMAVHKKHASGLHALLSHWGQSCRSHGLRTCLAVMSIPHTFCNLFLSSLLLGWLIKGCGLWCLFDLGAECEAGQSGKLEAAKQSCRALRCLTQRQPHLCFWPGQDVYSELCLWTNCPIFEHLSLLFINYTNLFLLGCVFLRIWGIKYSILAIKLYL